MKTSIFCCCLFYYSLLGISFLLSTFWHLKFQFHLNVRKNCIDSFVFYISFSFYSLSISRYFRQWIAVIGGWGNQRVIVRRKQGANVLREVQLVDILASDKWIAFLIQITKRTITINTFLCYDLHNFPNFILILV